LLPMSIIILHNLVVFALVLRVLCQEQPGGIVYSIYHLSDLASLMPSSHGRDKTSQFCLVRVGGVNWIRDKQWRTQSEMRACISHRPGRQCSPVMLCDQSWMIATAFIVITYVMCRTFGVLVTYSCCRSVNTVLSVYCDAVWSGSRLGRGHLLHIYFLHQIQKGDNLLHRGDYDVHLPYAAKYGGARI